MLVSRGGCQVLPQSRSSSLPVSWVPAPGEALCQARLRPRARRARAERLGRKGEGPGRNHHQVPGKAGGASGLGGLSRSAGEKGL